MGLVENKKEDAKLYYQQAIKNDLSLRVLDNNLGWIYLRRHQSKIARAEFERMVFCGPLDHNAYRGLGDLDYNCKKYADAKEKYSQAVRIKPDDKKALTGLAECLLRTNNEPGTKIILKKLKKIHIQLIYLVLLKEL